MTTDSVSRRSLLSASLLAAGAAASQSASATTANPLKPETKPTTDSIGKTPHTKFAVNVEMWWTKEKDFLQRIRNAAALGFPAVEFWPFQGKDIAAIAKLSAELNIAIAQFTAWGFEPGLNNPANENNFVKTVEEACGIAHQLKCGKMTVVAGNVQQGMTQEQMHAQVIKALKRVAPIVEKEKVMLILEPMNGRVDHPGHCLYGSVDALKICDAVNSPMVKINWDLYHMQISEGDLCGRLKDGIRHVGYLQLADHPGRNEPGTGEVNYSRVLRQAYELGYRDFVGLELRPKMDELTAAKACAAADAW